MAEMGKKYSTGERVTDEFRLREQLNTMSPNAIVRQILSKLGAMDNEKPGEQKEGTTDQAMIEMHLVAYAEKKGMTILEAISTIKDSTKEPGYLARLSELEMKLVRGHNVEAFAGLMEKKPEEKQEMWDKKAGEQDRTPTKRADSLMTPEQKRILGIEQKK